MSVTPTVFVVMSLAHYNTCHEFTHHDFERKPHQTREMTVSNWPPSQCGHARPRLVRDNRGVTRGKKTTQYIIIIVYYYLCPGLGLRKVQIPDDPRFEPRQEHKKNVRGFSGVKSVVLTRCPTPSCGYARQENDHARTLKIL